MSHDPAVPGRVSFSGDAPAGGLHELRGAASRPVDATLRVCLRWIADGQMREQAWFASGAASLRTTVFLPPGSREFVLQAALPDGGAWPYEVQLRPCGAAATLRYRLRATLAGFPRLLAGLQRLWSPLRARGPALPLRSADAYARYLAHAEVPIEDARPAALAHQATMGERPRFALFLRGDMPTDVADTLVSIRAQTWPHWLLFVPPDLAAGELGPDPRLHRVAPLRIAAVLERAALEASADFAVFLAPGDRLAPLALYALACESQRHPAADLLYTDEDRLDAAGRRCDPQLKAAWQPEALESGPTLGALVAMRLSRVTACGGWHESPAADYDLLLRVTEGLRREHVRHLPFVAVHRPHRPSLLHPDHVRALAARHPAAQIRPGRAPASLRLVRALPDPPPQVSVIVPTRDGGAHLQACLDSHARHTRYPACELILVDNQSRKPDTLALLQRAAQHADTQVMRFDAPFNFSAICNAAAARARGQILVLLNDDTEILDGDWLREMVSLACRPDVGAVGAKLYYPDGTVQHAGVALGAGGGAGHRDLGATREALGYRSRLARVQEVGAVTAACLAVERDKYRAVGGMDEIEFQVAFNDVDLCLKLAARGWRSLWTPYAELLHHESKSRGADRTPEQRQRFEREHAALRRRWAHRLDADPTLHPWMSRHDLDARLDLEAPVFRPWNNPGQAPAREPA